MIAQLHTVDASTAKAVPEYCAVNTAQYNYLG